VRSQSPDDLERDVAPNRMTHYNNSYVAMTIIRDVFHEICELVFRMSDLVLEAVRGDFVPFHSVDLVALHLEPGERATVDLELNIAICSGFACQNSVQMCEECTVVFDEARVSSYEVDDVRSCGLLSASLMVRTQVDLRSRCSRHLVIVLDT
jgi:hypothetical protein